MQAPHLIVFGGAAQKLIRTGRCTVAEFEEQGGWGAIRVARPGLVLHLFAAGMTTTIEIYFHVVREVIEVEEARGTEEPAEPSLQELPDDGRPGGSGVSAGSRPMSFEQCLQVIDGTTAEGGSGTSGRSSSTSQLKTVKWSTGYGDVLLTCSKPDGTMVYFHSTLSCSYGHVR